MHENPWITWSPARAGMRTHSKCREIGNRIHKVEMQLCFVWGSFICLFVSHLRTNWAAKRDYVTVVWTSFQIQISHKMGINKTCTFMNQVLQCFFANSRRSFYLIDLLLLFPSILGHLFSPTLPKSREPCITRWES